MAKQASMEEALDPQSLAALQREKFAAMLRGVLATNVFWKSKLKEFAAGVSLSDLPFTTRQEIQQDQFDHPPYGTNLTFSLASYCRLHQTSGTGGAVPLRFLDRAEDWEWWKKCWSVIYGAAGVTPDDRILFPFSFGPFIGFWAAFDAATARGNLCLPAGGMTTAARLRFLLDNQVTVICCTPTYALHMAECARRDGIELAGSTVRALIVAGEPGGSIPSTRTAIERVFNARVFDHIGMTEMGAYGFECEEAPGGVHIIESEFIAEVIDPASANVLCSNVDSPIGTAKRSLPVAPVEGELVLTNLGRWGSPLIRYRTGDRVRLTRGECRCGRHFARLEGGILGRTDDMLIIRGNNVYPSAIEAILREFPAVTEYRLTVAEPGAAVGMADLLVEIEPAADAGSAAHGELADRVTQAIRDRLNFRPHVTLADPGSLPRFEMKARRVVRHNKIHHRDTETQR